MGFMRSQAVEAAERLASAIEGHYAGAKGIQVAARRRGMDRVEVFLSSPMGHDLVSLLFYHNAHPTKAISIIDVVRCAL